MGWITGLLSCALLIMLFAFLMVAIQQVCGVDALRSGLKDFGLAEQSRRGHQGLAKPNGDPAFPGRDVRIPDADLHGRRRARCEDSQPGLNRGSPGGASLLSNPLRSNPIDA
jgi:hypothetical protein